MESQRQCGLHLTSDRLICRYVLPAAALSLFAAGPAAAMAQAQAAPDPIAAYLQPLIDDHTIAGAVTLVADRSSILYVKGIGARDLASQAPMPANAMFWIASTSKPMTTTAFMMLVDEGKISLDDPVEKYLPEFKGQKVRARRDDPNHLVAADHPIRIREILSHTSGLPFKSAAQPGALDLLPLKDAVRSFAAEPLLFQPGTAYSYSNEGINTAARILEVVTGIPYERFMQERLFFPLGMKDTTFWPDSSQIARIATTYKLDEQAGKLVPVQIEQLTYPLDDRQHRFPMPAGGLFSTAADVAKFCQMILNGGTFNGRRYVSEKAIHEMTTRQNGTTNEDGYGLGWSVRDGSAGHGGAYKNAMNIDLNTGRILVFMVQQDGPWGTAKGDAIVSTLERLANEVKAAPASGAAAR